MVRKALIIEDSPDLALLGRRLLEKNGFIAASAMQGREALSLLESFHPDVILLDLSLPDMLPDELVQAIRSLDQCKETPLILASGNSELKTWGERLGTNFLLVKPYDRTSLSKILELACPAK